MRRGPRPSRSPPIRSNPASGLLDVIGGLPEPNPLNAQIHGQDPARRLHRREGDLREPAEVLRHGALCSCPTRPGSSRPIRAWSCRWAIPATARPSDEYQSMGALLALNGMAALVFDAIDESERMQYHGERGPYVFDKNWGPYLHGTYGHQMVGIGSILLGRNTARIEICDTMRAIDYLQSRPEVDPQRIGCTGNSGGGIVTAYMVALDDRVQAAAPSCYLDSLPTCSDDRSARRMPSTTTWAAMTAGPQADRPVDDACARCRRCFCAGTTITFRASAARGGLSATPSGSTRGWGSPSGSTSWKTTPRTTTTAPSAKASPAGCRGGCCTRTSRSPSRRSSC